MYRSTHHDLLCTIAGLDPTGGAGVAADLRTFQAHGARGCPVLSAVTVQDETGLKALAPVPADLLAAQLRAALGEGPGAAKTGMLATRATVEAVADVFDEQGAPPLVVDPVLAASAGGALLEEAGIAALTPRLAPHARLLTPNLPEAARLLGLESVDPGGEARAAEALCARGWRAVLLKGGHGAGEECVDLLVEAGAVHRHVRPRLPGPTLRGTGCTLSAAIAARLARGEALAEAVQAAGDWLHELIARAHAAGRRHLAPLPPDPRGQ